MSNLPSSTPKEHQETSDLTEYGYQLLRTSLAMSVRYLDIAAAILLSTATLATAWCAYQSTRWGGVQATSFAEASSFRIQAGNQSNPALVSANNDAAALIELINAHSSGNPALVSSGLDNLIRSGLRPYFDGSNELQPNAGLLSASGVQPAPTEQAASVNHAAPQSAELLQQAQLEFLQATAANQTGDDYMLATVLFASVLSFAGVSTKFKRLKIQAALVSTGVVMLMLGVVQIAELPIH